MGLFANYLDYLKEDAETDRQLKTFYKVGIRYLLVFVLYILQWVNILTYTNANEIQRVIWVLANVLSVKDIVLAFSNVEALKTLDVWYNLLIEGLIIISILPINLIFNMGEEFAYNITQITPVFIVAISLYLLVMSGLNLGLAFWEAGKSKLLKHEKFLLVHNFLIIGQCLILLIFGFSLYGNLDYSDFYSELIAYWFGRY